MRRPMILLGCLVACGVALAFPPTPAVAQGDARAKREARKLLTKGDRSLKRGDRMARRKREERAAESYRQALDAYKKAYEVYPQPQIYFAIGNAEEKLGLYVDAHSHYLRLLEEADNPSDKLRSAVEARIDAVLQNLAKVRFTAEPEGATIFVDEQEIGKAPLAEPLILEPGPHRISVRKDGYTPGADQFVAKPGDKLDRKVVLEVIPKVEDAPPPPPPPPPKPLGPPPGRWILISSLIGTGLLASGATGFGIASVTQHGIFTDEAKRLVERENAREKGERYAITSDVFLGATILAAGWTAYYYYGIYRPRAATWEEEGRKRAEQQRAWLAPYLDQGGGGLAIGGRF